MRKAIVFLAVLLAILIVVAAILFFTDVLPSRQSEETQEITDIVVSTESTQTPTEPVTTEELTTVQQIEFLPDETSVVLNGVKVDCYLLEGTRVISAQTFAEAAGLILESEDPVRISGKDSIEYTEDGAIVNGVGDPSVGMPVSYEGMTYLPFDSLVAALEYPEYFDDETGVSYYSPSARRFEIPQNVNVPVLMYHAVSDDMWGINELFVSPSSMEEQLAYLVDNGYDAIWFEDLAHLEEYDKPVILTFDDGYDDNYLYLFPLLQKYNVKATIFVIGNAPGTQHKATAEQIKEMSDSGLVSIQSHSYTHADMDGLDYDSTLYEMSESKKAITRITGKEPYVLCYPTGKYNDYTLQLGPEYYMFGIKMNGGLYNTSSNPFLINRYYVARYTDIYTFAAYLSSAGT